MFAKPATANPYEDEVGVCGAVLSVVITYLQQPVTVVRF